MRQRHAKPMNNFEPCDISEEMTRDLNNECKQKMQDLRPVVELLKIKAGPDTLIGIEKEQKLMLMGYSVKEIKKMCKPSLNDRVKFELQFQQHLKNEERELKRFNCEIKKQQQLDEIKAKCRSQSYP